MFFRRQLSMSSPRSRRWITALALLAYVASVVGYPLPLPAGDEKRNASAPYPCQDHACGCHSAEQCWESCCCYTPAERLAWVRRNGVALPATTLAALTSAAENQNENASKSCCRHESLPAESACGTCDDAHGCDHASKAEAVIDESEKSRRGIRVDWVNAIAAQKCHGLTTMWLLSGANLPVEIRDLWQFDWQLAGYVSIAQSQLASPAYEPLVPPPCQPFST